MQRYQKMATYLESIGLESPEVENVDSISRLLEMCSARYLTNGLKSLRTIPSSSVDFMWSQAVLEHVRRSEFLDTMVELRRIVRGNGACSHRIDLRDHLGGQLNHLRFSEQVWESDFMSTSGFYTNRIRFPKMMELFREAGFEPKVMQKDTWDQLPTARSLMDEAFREYSDSDLCVSGFDVVLIPVQ
jgi:predicted SAM-dependent methyltransferase